MKIFDDRQLKFDLQIDEVKDDAEERFISPEEASKISQAARLIFDDLRIKNQSNEGCDWFDDYQKLIEWGWPWRIATYIAWASSPKIGRWPETLKELSTEILGLTGPRVIYKWRQNHPTIDQIIAIMQASPLWNHRRDVIEALIESARNPDYKNFNDRKLFLEMVGDYIPKSKLEFGKSAEGGVEDLSEEELRIAAGEIEPSEINQLSEEDNITDEEDEDAA